MTEVVRINLRTGKETVVAGPFRGEEEAFDLALTWNDGLDPGEARRTEYAARWAAAARR